MNQILNKRVPLDPLNRIYILGIGVFIMLLALVVNAVIFDSIWMTLVSLILAGVVAFLAFHYNEVLWQVTFLKVVKDLAPIVTTWLFFATWSAAGILVTLLVFLTVGLVVGSVLLVLRTSKLTRILIVIGVIITLCLGGFLALVMTIEGNPVTNALSSQTTVFEKELEVAPEVGDPISFSMSCGREEKKLTDAEIESREVTFQPVGCSDIFTLRLSWPGSNK